MNSKIAVIGCGWLGFPLAKTLIDKGCQVHGTTTTTTKIHQLNEAGIVPFLVHMSSEGIRGNLKSCLSNCTTVIINIPPGLRKNPEQDYFQKMKFLLEDIVSSSIEHVLFIGSTSVYDDEASFPLITETSKTSESKNARQLLEVEQLFQNHNKLQTTVLRFSGLFAEDRHPAYFLSGRKDIKNPLAPVNLIHRDDCIQIILGILKLQLWGNVFNASTSSNPPKEWYYTSVCKNLNILIPEFDNTTVSKGKIIDPTALIEALNYTFKVTLPSTKEEFSTTIY